MHLFPVWPTHAAAGVTMRMSVTRDALAGWTTFQPVSADEGTSDNLNLRNPVRPNGFEHPVCGFGEQAVIRQLANNFPIGPKGP